MCLDCRERWRRMNVILLCLIWAGTISPGLLPTYDSSWEAILVCGQEPMVRRSPLPQSPDRPPQVPPEVRWRYRFRNGHWWYWREDGSWAFWSGTQWYKYAPQSYRRWYLQWRLAQDEAEVARLKELIRSGRARSSVRTWVPDPGSFLPFAN